jgi:SAM-dependent methyltransferase
VGCDKREDFVIYRKEFSSQGEFLVADGHTLPFPDSSFGGVYLAGVLEHVSNPRLVLNETYRVLRTGGRLVLDVPHPRYERVMSRIAPGCYDDQLHKYVFKPRGIRQLVESAGFEVLESSPRMWKAALYFSARWLRARLENNLEFDPDSGELLSYPENEQGRLSEWFDRLLWLSENRSASPKRFYLLSPLRWLNWLYPWMTYIEAEKRPG